MMTTKKYGASADYEDKLQRVMERFKADDWDFDWNRKGNCWIQFSIDGESFYFSHSVEKAKEKGINLQYGSDAFAQLVLTLEDLARANERGTFHLKKILGSMIAIEPPKLIPQCFLVLEFNQMPKGMAEVDHQYKQLLKKVHPDVGGSTVKFKEVKQAYEEAKEYFEN